MKSPRGVAFPRHGTPCIFPRHGTPCIYAFLVALLCFLPPRLASAEDASQTRDRTRQTLLYGIDSQILEIVEKLKSSRDAGYAKELAAILAEPRTPEVRKAILGLLEDQREKEGDSVAKGILSGGEEKRGDLIAAAIRYLSTIESKGLSPLLVPLVDSSDGGVSSAAIRALGRTTDSSNAALLIAKLKSADFSDARKTDIILALGDLKDAEAVDELLRIVKNTDEGNVRRMYAADSLGKIGDARALPALKTLFGEKDALIRAYAASSLSQFALDDVFPLLLQGLKDENWKVRQQCAKSLQKTLSPDQASTALPMLSYKAEFDPVSQVRLEAIHAIGEIGGDAAVQFLIGLYRTAVNPMESREAALVALVQKALPVSLEAIRSVVTEEWKAADQKTLESTARVLSTTAGSGLRDLYLKLLESANPVVRSYAIRGIAGNGFADCVGKLRELSEQDPSSAVRKEADRALSKL